MKIKILKVELSEENQNEIFNMLIERFDLNCSDIYGKGQEINFPINEDIECYAKMDLFQEGYSEIDTNAPVITEQFVGRFSIDFFIDCESIEVKDWNIEDRIRENYRI